MLQACSGCTFVFEQVNDYIHLICFKIYYLSFTYNIRNPIADLESLSSTDIKCQWSKLKQPTLTQYKPLPVDTFDCCYKKTKKINIDIDAETVRLVYKLLINYNIINFQPSILKVEVYIL